MSELRKDPTRGQWALVRPPSTRPSGDVCPFCPGHEHLTPPEIAAYRKDGAPAPGPGWTVRVIPEADPYFRIEAGLVREGVGLYDKVTPRGAAELIIESPRHDDTPGTMPLGQWEQVLWMYRDRIRDLKRDQAIRDLLITRRYRRPGARITHPYSRLTAIPIIFDEVRRKLTEARQYYEYKRRCVYCDIVRQELGEERRVVRATPAFVLLAPYAPRARLEVWVLPRQHAAAYEEALMPGTAPELAGLLRGYFQTLAEALGNPSFEMTLYTCPNRSSRLMPGEWATIGEDYHWHLEIVPGADRLTTVGGIHVSEVFPEDYALQLREAWVSSDPG